MRVEPRILELHTRHAFHIARMAAPPARRSVWIRLIADDGAEGWGEAAPNAYYGETTDTVAALLPAFSRILAQHPTAGKPGPLDGPGPADDPSALEPLERAVAAAVGGNPAARAGLSAALHDLLGKRLGRPVWQLWGLDAARMPLSSYTLGIDRLDAMRDKLSAARGYPILKVKVGTADDKAVLTMIRDAAPAARIRVDANTAWTTTAALALLPFLEDVGVELIEQPVAAGDLEGLRRIRSQARVPIIADESCLDSGDIPRLAGCVDGVNIKLEKCGSLQEARHMVNVARAHDMQVMVGCMLCTTLGIAAAMQVAPLADYADLDGAALLADDPFTGPHLSSAGRLVLSDDPGLGVSLRPEE